MQPVRIFNANSMDALSNNTAQTAPTVLAPASHTAAWLNGLRYLGPPIAIAGLSVAAGQVHYLLFHTLAEFFSIIIAGTALVVASTSFRFTRNHFTVYVAVVIGWCGALDLVHTVTYKGMQLIGVDDPNIPTQFWVVARFIQALALLGAPLFLRRSVPLVSLHAVLGLTALGVSLLIFLGGFPTAFVEGKGLTPFKIYAEYVIIAMLATSALLLWRQKHLMPASLLLSMQLALLAMILSEAAFTRYVSVYGPANELGHVFKIFAYWFVYMALVQSTLREPFDMLSRTASTYDAVPDPALLVRQDGLILQANQAAARYAGVASPNLIGRPLHALFHGAGVSVGDCPVCARIARGESEFSAEIERGGAQGTVECTVAPFFVAGRDRSYVQVVRDITERKRLAVERERLVHNLGKRVKELRCLYALTNLINQEDQDIAGLLAGTVAVLPSAFAFPGKVSASIASQWGAFGSSDASLGARALTQELRVHGEAKGSLWVRYGYDAALGSDPFLPEERELLATVAQRVGDAIERMQARVQVQRLTYLYEMLSATNRAIVRSTNHEELLDTVLHVLVRHSAFPMLFIARTDTGRMPLRIAHSLGIAAQKMPDLLAELENPDSAFAKVFDVILKGQVVSASLPERAQANAWSAYLLDQGIREWAVLPMMREGQLFGVVGLYLRGPGSFDEPQLNLLNEMAEDLAFALNGLAATERRRAAEQRADASEFRFREVFDASPTPMQIESIASKSVRSINRAFQQWLGYSAQDIRTEDDWFNLAYADPDLRQQVQAQWPRFIAQAKATGEEVRSSELRLRAKDGSERLAVATMTLVGDDAIIAWSDMTEIRRNERALRESEEHFRGMIEQTVTGIYVRRGDRLVYVNPSYCEMGGWSREELMDRDVWSLTTQDPDAVRRIRESWAVLEAGGRSVRYDAPLLCKNGQIRELALHASPIQWDAAPATIVMAEDITERKRAEAKIADYVVRLQASMRGTLQAVSNMVDLRDPYTAGHQRRVGVIAGAIAAELGWSAQRCEEIELVGLVHDLGKISVPAEILSKPGHLSPMEKEMVRGHAQAGYEILKDVPFTFPVADVIRQHHERLDGSGYPQGLQGDQIMPEARVLAVADVLESMSAHRPYRPALGVAAALAELEQGRGRLYATDVLDATLRLLRDKGFQLPR